METTLGFLVQMLVTSGIIWAATMTFKRLFRDRMSPRAHLLIWLVFIVRLVVPVIIETGYHFVELPLDEAAAPGSVLNTARADDLWTDTPPQFEDGTRQLTLDAAPRIREHASGDDSAADAAASSVPSTHLQMDLTEICIAVWIIGAIVSASVSLHGYRVLRRNVHIGMCTGADPLHLLFQRCMSELGIRKRVFLAVQDGLAGGPALMHPNIVLLPVEMQHMDPDAVRMAFRHELTHFQRKDHLKALFMGVLRCVWWWNPVVWLAVREIREDIETACDSDVVKRLDKCSKAAYAQTVLSMYGSTETNNAVLAMAAHGGARKNAERRIRGMYRRTRSAHGTTACSLLLAAVLGITCFTTVLQPGIAAQAAADMARITSGDVVTSSVHPASTEAEGTVQYIMSDHWSDVTYLEENFRVSADTDVLVPDTDSYPVQRFVRRDMTQDLVDDLTHRFAADTTFLAAHGQAELDQLIDKLEEQASVNDANGTEPYETDIAELNELYELRNAISNASADAAANVEYDYATDYAGNVLVDDGPIYINVEAPAEDGGVIQISARRQSASDPMQYPYFTFSAAAYATKSQDLRNAASATEELRWAELIEDDDARMQELDRLRVIEQDAKTRLDLYGKSPMDLQVSRESAMALLKDLGIDDVQITVCDNALLGPAIRDDTAMSQPLEEPGVYLEFQRACGGIPCIAQMGQAGIMLRSDVQQHSAPFMPESGTIVFDADWNVRVFHWESPALAATAPEYRSDLISADAAKDLLIQEIYANECAVSKAYIGAYGLAYDIEEMRLVMAYTDVPEDPESVLAIPAWYARAQGRALHPEEDAAPDTEPVLYNVQEVMISALDGSPILMPGSMQGLGTAVSEEEFDAAAAT